jgi:hypothetical protein
MGLLSNNNFLHGNLAAGIHLNILSDGRWQMHGVQIEKGKGLISIIKRYSNIETTDDFFNQVPDSVPVILSIEGKGVIHRQINANDSNSPVLQVFPDATPEDFLVQIQQIGNSLLLATLIRSETVNDILNIFKEKKLLVFNVILGPFTLNALWPLINEKPDEYNIDFYRFSLKEDVIQNLEIVSSPYPEKSILFSGEFISSTLLIPYANALTFFTGISKSLSVSYDISRKARDEFLYKKAVRFSSAGLLGLLFLILLVNYFLFENYNAKYIQSNLQYKTDIELINRLENLKKELNMKESLIDENGLASNSKFSLYADRIAESVPQQVKLTSLKINPVLSKPKPDKEFGIHPDKILIGGQCLYSLVLDEWIELLSRESWIKRIEILQFKQENKGTPGEFVIEIDF